MTLLLVLCILSLPLTSRAIKSSRDSVVDDVTVRFIVNATPVLYPPSRVSLQLCISYDDTIKLSRILSSHRLTHSIRNTYEEFDLRIYNNLEHRNLYVLDLDCDYAVDVLRQANSKRMFIAPTKWLLLQDRRTIVNDDNANLTTTYDDSVLEVLEGMEVYPDSDVVLARRFDRDFLELSSVYRPSPQLGAIWEKRGNWTPESGLRMKTFEVASARRRNLRQTALKGSVVITNPDTINHLTDFKDKSIDPVSKASFPWVLHLANRMNATISFIPMKSWGYPDKNGTWNDGMIGLLNQREVDIGSSAMFIVPERLGVVQFIPLYLRTRARFVFRRPLLSTVKNIFTLPFQRNVWIATGVFLLVVFLILYLSTKWEYHQMGNRSSKSALYWNQLNPSKPTISDNFLIILGAFAQQGYAYEPYKVPTRIVTLMVLVLALSLYASYTANIVGLLQSTTDSIKTVPDLLYSPLKMGAQDIVWNRYYFKTAASQDPIRKSIFEKIEPKGRKSNWLTIEEGVQRLRNELFAFHAEVGTIYQLMQETYLEEEKCGITEIDYLHVAYPFIAVQMQSPYLEIIKNGALKIREHGLTDHEERHFYTGKPVCSSQTSFISIGITECYFALVSMGYGILLTAIVFAIELLWNRKQNTCAKKTSDTKAIDYAGYFD